MNKRLVRVLLTASITAALSIPLIAQIQNNPATPATPPAATAPAVDPNKVVITIGDTKITAGDFDAFVADLDPETKDKVLSRPDGRKQLADEFVKVKLLSAEARKRKLDESRRVKFVYEELLANAITTDLFDDKTGDEKYFNEHRADFDELKARHILVGVVGGGVPKATLNDTQAKAKADDLKKRLDKGEDFAVLAKANSDDTQSGLQGGSLGTMTRGMMVAPFEDTAFSLKKGEISAPVKTQFGWHIIQITDRTPGTFEQARQIVLKRRLDDLIAQLKESAKPEIDESFFAPPKAPTTAPAK